MAQGRRKGGTGGGTKEGMEGEGEGQRYEGTKKDKREVEGGTDRRMKGMREEVGGRGTNV